MPPRRCAEALEEADRRARLDHDGDAMIRSLRSLITAYLRPDRWPLWRLAARVQRADPARLRTQDRLVDPRSARRAERAFPSPRLVVLPDSGHVSQMEHPEVVAREVRRLLDGAVSRTGPGAPAAAR